MQKRSISNPSTMYSLLHFGKSILGCGTHTNTWMEKRNMWNSSTCIRIRICANSLHERNSTVPLNQICVTQDRNEFAHNMKIYSNINVCVSPTNDINNFFSPCFFFCWKRGRGTLIIRFFHFALLCFAWVNIAYKHGKSCQILLLYASYIHLISNSFRLHPSGESSCNKPLNALH